MYAHPLYVDARAFITRLVIELCSLAKCACECLVFAGRSPKRGSVIAWFSTALLLENATLLFAATPLTQMFLHEGCGFVIRVRVKCLLKLMSLASSYCSTF